MQIAIDTGGTFTDCVYWEGRELRVLKVRSTPANPASAVLSAVAQIAGDAEVEVRHGTTVGTNVLLERKGARVAFITTAGFEDTTAIGRQARPKLYVPARFLSGGEFPLPIVQGGTGNSTAITIVFKPYGVKVDFTPTVNPDGSIRLKVAPEVSALDYSNAVTISGFTIPALSTRRAETEVELINGQSFVLSGLLDRRTTANLSKTPGIASVPILGQLFRSKDVNHSVVELVVLVTATVVDPTGHPQAPVLPKMVVPNLDREHFDSQFPVHAAPPPAPMKDQP